MAITINNDYKGTYEYTNMLVDNNRESELSFRQNGQWDSFEEIIGFPFQFNDNADPKKIKAGSKILNNYGRVFSDTICNDTNLVFLEPGVPKFMPAKYMETQRNKEERQNLLKALTMEDGDSIQGLFSGNGFKHDSRYYVFQSSFGDYQNFVNSMATYIAARLNLNKEDKDLDKIKMMSVFRGGNIFSKTSIPFYYDSSTTNYSESGSNSTAESKLASMMGGLGGTIREANFLLNRSSADESIISSSTSYVTEKLGSLGSKIPGIGNVLDGLMGNLSLSFNGANLLFPEIWSDSSFRKNITLGFKFASPYGDKLSIYNNVIYPVICLLALALPRQANKGTMGYNSPFLIKAFCKGWFNCDLGMVESIDINKGSNNSWSVDGLPLEVTVTLTIKDLYSTIMMTQGSGGLLLNNNTGLSEYLETWAGMQITNPDIFGNFKSGVQESLWNISNKISLAGTELELSMIGKTYSTVKEVSSNLLATLDKIFFGDDIENN